MHVTRAPYGITGAIDVGNKRSNTSLFCETTRPFLNNYAITPLNRAIVRGGRSDGETSITLR